MKQEDYKKIVNPVVDDPMLFFDFLLTGDIIVREGINTRDNLKAEYTIELFGLNCESLVLQRRSIAESLVNLKKQGGLTLDIVYEYFPNFSGFIKCIFAKIPN